MDIDISSLSGDEPPVSALDGYMLHALDTDPEEALALMQVNAKIRSIQILYWSKRTFKNGREGYIVVTYTP